jgi:alpha 1,2-mannosyltransferase
LHYILTFSHEEYGKATSLDNLKDKLTGLSGNSKHNRPPPEPAFLDEDTRPAPPRKANATFVILARNGDLKGVIESIKQLEDRFNRHYHYPYVFLNDQPFDAEFKRFV